MKKCYSCKTELPDKARFCSNCGGSTFEEKEVETEETFASNPLIERWRGVIWGILACVAVFLLIVFIANQGDSISFSRKCSKCGDTITGEAILVGERKYCDYDCYLSDVFS